MNLVYKDEDENIIVGGNPEAENSTINFYGKNNTLYCSERINLKNSTINFYGNNSLVYLSSSVCDYKINVSINTNSVFYMGNNVYIDDTINVILSEHKHCFIGNECLISSGVCIKNSDAHPIFDCNTKLRLNLSKSVYIGDHVWIGQNVMILKGTQIDSGSILGAMSVVAGKKIGHNESWGGNPSKLIKQNVFWDNLCVHAFREIETNAIHNYSSYVPDNTEHAIFEYNEGAKIEWTDLENVFSSDIKALEKCEFLMNFNNKINKNRFVHNS